MYPNTRIFCHNPFKMEHQVAIEDVELTLNINRMVGNKFPPTILVVKGMLKNCDWFGLVFLFNGISVFMDYLMPNLSF